MNAFFETVGDLLRESGFYYIISYFKDGGWQTLVMLLLSLVLIYLAIVKNFEPLLLLPIAFGMLLANLPLAGLSSADEGGLLYYLYQGVALKIYPPLIFLGIGVMTDFGPLIANPSSLLLGAAAQIGIFVTFIGASLLGFTLAEAGAVAIIGGADGPTAIFTAQALAQHLTPSIAIAAYSYMALVPVIQPPIMRLLTTKKERAVRMTPAAGGQQKGKDYISHSCDACCFSAFAFGCDAGGNAYARKPAPRMRRYRASGQNGGK